ncbi:hypothetical protein BFP70_09475 [Thioclava sp. SK-1]|nr:hypothetical protein BFP70_09475 [Thioclava sp. SK-1]
MRKLAISTLGLLLLAACSDPLDTARYTLDPPAPTERLANRLGRAELRDVSLPDYASGQEITFQTADGALRSTPDNIWADDPARAMTLVLARQITQLSGATVLAEPWPLAAEPQRRVEVRVEKFVAAADGMVHLSGVYIVSPASFSANGGDVVRPFSIAVPVLGADGQPTQDPAQIARAQSQAVADLARAIASLS